jgi:nucleoside-diphosphate-sugar epimerase
MGAPLLLIGATGQTGRNILQRCSGREVLALVRQPENVKAAEQTRVVYFDFSGAVPKFVGDWPSMAIATIPVWLLAPHLDELAERGVERLVCFSTTSIFGKSATSNARERETVARVAQAEDYLVTRAVVRGVGLTILRPTLIYGEGQDKTITAAARFIKRFGFYPVFGTARGKRQPVHADDLANAALSALESDITIDRSYALGGGETLAYKDMVARIFTTLEKPTRILRVPMLPEILDVVGRVMPGSELTSDVAHRMNLDLDFDDGTAACDFGYKPRFFLQGGKADFVRSTL